MAGQCGLICSHSGCNGEGMDHGAVCWKRHPVVHSPHPHTPIVRGIGLWPFPLDSTMLPTLYPHFHCEIGLHPPPASRALKMATAVHAKLEQLQHTVWLNSDCQNYVLEPKDGNVLM
jgi:hypothetical protein